MEECEQPPAKEPRLIESEEDNQFQQTHRPVNSLIGEISEGYKRDNECASDQTRFGVMPCFCPTRQFVLKSYFYTRS